MIINQLLADAEAGEDGGEDLGGGDLAGDLAEVVDGFAEVLGYEFAGEVLGEGVDGAGRGLGGVEECLRMSGVGYYCGIAGDAAGNLVSNVLKRLKQLGQVVTGGGGDFDNLRSGRDSFDMGREFIECIFCYFLIAGEI